MEIKSHVLSVPFLSLALSFVAIQTSQAGNNLHLIEEDTSTGFAIYRTGIPSDAQDVAELCQLGIQEMMVLSGDADQAEWKYKDQCPTLKVVYNVDTTHIVPLDKKFLDYFDSWVTDAKSNGKKIAFRCSCGCHRTGRLAGYYQMKYQHLTYGDAKIVMADHGKLMALLKSLYRQLTALDDYIHGRPCSELAEFCVKE